MSKRFPLMFAALLALAGAAPQGGQTLVTPATIQKLATELATKYGESERSRIERGLNQAARFWRKEDGNEADFAEVAREQIAQDSAVRNALFSRMEFGLESLDGHMNEIARDFRRQSDLDIGEIYPFDEILAGYDPAAHVNDDFFSNRLAFAVLLNFPVTTLEQRLTEGESWSRRQWAEARLAERFTKRVPADVNLAIADARAGGRPLHRPLQHLDAPPRGREGPAPLPREAAPALALEPARPDQGRLRRQAGRPRAPAPDRAGLRPHRDADDSRPRRGQPARGLGPGHQRGQAFDGQGLRRGHAARHEDLERARARHALRHAALDLRGRAQGRSVLAARPDAHRPALQRRPPDPRGAGARDARGRPLLAARAEGRGAHRVAPGTPARAVRRLVRRLPPARLEHGRAARRDRPQALPDGRGLQGGHPEPARAPRLLEGEGRLPRGAHRRGPRARLGPRPRRPAARGPGPPAHARREGRA